MKKRKLAKISRRGRHLSSDVRKPSHVPLNAEERAKLGAMAAAMGLPYATWARATLLAVAEWPLENQPLKMARFARIEHPQTCSEEQVPASLVLDGARGGGS